MRAEEDKTATFKKVGECLYRYTPTGKYYARIKRPSKEIRRSLGMTERATTKRKLADLHKEIDRTDAGTTRVTLGALCDRYMATVQNQSAKTLKRKRHIVARLKADFPGGSDMSAGKVQRSQVEAWLASYELGTVSYNLFLEFIRATFALAVADRILPHSLVDGIKTVKRELPIRRTPPFEDFRAIVASIRRQPFADTAQDSGDFVEFLGLATPRDPRQPERQVGG